MGSFCWRTCMLLTNLQNLHCPLQNTLVSVITICKYMYTFLVMKILIFWNDWHRRSQKKKKKKNYTVFKRWHRKLSHNWAARIIVQNKSTTICKLHGHIFHKYFLLKKSTMVGYVICPHSWSDCITILSHGSLCLRIKCFFFPPTFNSWISCYACIVSFHVWFFSRMEHFVRPVTHTR